MDKKQQFKIPKFVIAIAIILVVALLFLILVFMRFTSTLETYERDHNSATSEINSLLICVHKDEICEQASS